MNLSLIERYIFTKFRCAHPLLLIVSLLSLSIDTHIVLREIPLVHYGFTDLLVS